MSLLTGISRRRASPCGGCPAFVLVQLAEDAGGHCLQLGTDLVDDDHLAAGDQPAVDEQVGGAAGGPVELLRRRRPALRPHGLVPAGAEDGAGARARGSGHGLEHLVQGTGRGEVEGGQRQRRLRHVHVGVHEPGRQQPPVEVDHVHGGVLQGLRRLLGADPGHAGAVDQQGRGERVGGQEPLVQVGVELLLRYVPHGCL